MYAQPAIKQNPIRRNGATDIVMRGVQKCTRGVFIVAAQKKAVVMLYQIRHGNRSCKGSDGV